MVHYLVIAGLVSCAAVSLFRPSIGVATAYLFSILTPQEIWFWDFEGLRPEFWVLVPTLIGFAIALGRGKYDLEPLKNRRTLELAGLWLCFLLSYLMGPFVDVKSPYRFFDPSWENDVTAKIFLLYFVACVCMAELRQLKTLVWILVVSVAYLIYWANYQYFAGHVFGRLGGPSGVTGTSTYADQNAFAMVFVIGQPFLWYVAQTFKSRLAVARWAIWAFIPMGWNALFLTASRGGLVGIVVVTAIMALRGKRRKLALLIIPAFVLAYTLEAGSLMKTRADEINTKESSAAERIEAWKAASRMIEAHPFIGVGLASFGPAFPYYSDKQPRVAHNTVLQITAESGLPAGILYVMLAAGTIAALWRNGRALRTRPGDPNPEKDTLYLINEATLIGIIGLTSCGLFLSLQMFEIQYFLFVVANCTLYLSRSAEQDEYRDVAVPSSNRLYRAVARRRVGLERQRKTVSEARRGQESALQSRR